MICRDHPAIVSNTPARCYSPMACNGWGYCRNRNMGPRGVPDEATRAEWQKLDNPERKTP
jgi:hypothetical protein